MGTIRTLQELAAIGRQRTVDGRSLSLRRDDLDHDVTLDSLSADRIAFEQTALDGALTIRSCRIEELVIDHVTADSLLITNSRIGRLTVRNTPVGCDITVTDSSLVSADLHTCGTVSLQRLRSEQSVNVSALRGPVTVTDSHLAALVLRSQVTAGRQGRPRVAATGLHLTEDLLLDDLWLSELRIRDVETRNLTLRRVRLDTPLAASELRCRDAMRINGLVVPLAASTISDSDIRGPLDFHGLELHPAAATAATGSPTPAPPSTTSAAPAATPSAGTAPARVEIRNSSLGRLAAESAQPTVVCLQGSSVTSSLALPTGHARYELGGATPVNDMELAGATFRTTAQVNAFLRDAFTDVTAVTLESLRNALARRRRNREEDQLYYIARQRESRSLSGLRRLFARSVLGGVLGWGVRARNPVRVLFAGVLLTAVGLHLGGATRTPGQSLLDAGGAAKALVLSLALWLNVGTGAPQQLTSSGWTALAVAFTVGGLVLTTLIVGIVIRKLVR